jgi:hypothetical protein
MMHTQVCNHPDLFEGRSIVSAFDMPPLALQLPSLAVSGALLGAPEPLETVDLGAAGLVLTSWEQSLAVWEAQEVDRLQVRN